MASKNEARARKSTAVGQVLLAAKGMRSALGRFAPSIDFNVAVQLLEGIIEVTSRLADEEEFQHPAELLAAAAAQRVEEALGDTKYANLATHTGTCAPGCQHVTMLLLLPANMIGRFAAQQEDRIKLEELTEPAPGIQGLMGHRVPRRPRRSRGGMMPPELDGEPPEDEEEHD